MVAIWNWNLGEAVVGIVRWRSLLYYKSLLVWPDSSFAARLHVELLTASVDASRVVMNVVESEKVIEAVYRSIVAARGREKEGIVSRRAV